MKKRLIILAFIAFSLMLSFASASTSNCVAEETMFTLFRENNSHIAVFNSSFNDSNYNVKICYRDFFGKFEGDENPWKCNGDNSLLSVSGSTNAHAAKTDFYQQKICYGDLKCSIKTSCDTEKNEKTIISIYSENNSHVSYKDMYEYPLKLCCSKIDAEPTPVEYEDYNRTWINISIVGLEDGKAYLTGVGINLSYTIGSAEEARNISVEWSIMQDNIATSNGSFILNFTSKGQKTVKLRAINYYGARADIEINVLAIPGGANGGNEALAFISKPKYRELKKLALGERNISVEYSGEGSYVLKSNYDISNCNSGQVTCLAGSCPEKIKNVPAGCNEINIQGRESNANYGGLYFNWFESNLNSGSLKDANALFGIIKYPNTKFSIRPHDKEITLILNYTNSLESISLSQTIGKRYTVGQCLANSAGEKSREYIWDVINGVEQTTATVNPRLYGINGNDPKLFDNIACKGPDGKNQTEDDCCPLGLVCSENSGCVIKNNYDPGCGARSGTNENTCKRTPLYEIKFPSDSNNCGAVAVYCKWDEPSKTCSNAGDYYNISNGDVTATKSISYRNLTTCDIASGYWKVNVTTKCDGACKLEGCGNSTIATLPCGLPLFKVPVFGLWQMIISILGIAIGYSIMLKKIT